MERSEFTCRLPVRLYVALVSPTGNIAIVCTFSSRGTLKCQSVIIIFVVCFAEEGEEQQLPVILELDLIVRRIAVAGCTDSSVL